MNPPPDAEHRHLLEILDPYFKSVSKEIHNLAEEMRHTRGRLHDQSSQISGLQMTVESFRGRLDSLTSRDADQEARIRVMENQMARDIGVETYRKWAIGLALTVILTLAGVVGLLVQISTRM